MKEKCKKWISGCSLWCFLWILFFAVLLELRSLSARLCYKNKEIWKDANWNKITVSKHGKIKKGKQPTLDTIPGKYIRILTIFVRQFLFWIWNSVKMPQNKIFNIIFYIMSFRLVDFFCIFLYWCQIEIH